ncbi:MAG: DUF6443 domain-containing protein [Alistipes sp.]|nr:DUF6443 domain-containing protein [Alistipes sp.]
MKNILLPTISMLFICNGIAQQPDENWKIERTFISPEKSITDIVYYDGLGRPEQSIKVAASPDNKNIITLFSYESRLYSYNFLPYVGAGSTSSRVADPFAEQRKFYAELFPSESQSNRTFYETRYETSPFNRITDYFNVGKDYEPQGKKLLSLMEVIRAATMCINWN